MRWSTLVLQVLTQLLRMLTAMNRSSWRKVKFLRQSTGNYYSTQYLTTFISSSTKGACSSLMKSWHSIILKYHPKVVDHQLAKWAPKPLIIWGDMLNFSPIFVFKKRAFSMLISFTWLVLFWPTQENIRSSRLFTHLRWNYSLESLSIRSKACIRCWRLDTQNVSQIQLLERKVVLAKC